MVVVQLCALMNESRQHFLARPRTGERKAGRVSVEQGVEDARSQLEF